MTRTRIVVHLVAGLLSVAVIAYGLWQAATGDDSDRGLFRVALGAVALALVLRSVRRLRAGPPASGRPAAPRPAPRRRSSQGRPRRRRR